MDPGIILLWMIVGIIAAMIGLALIVEGLKGMREAAERMDVEEQELREWKAIANDAYCREPDRRIAAQMALAIGRADRARSLEHYKRIAFAGLISRLIERPLVT